MGDRYLDPFTPYLTNDEPSWYDPEPDPDQRLRHVIYVDGRLVDTWSESVRGTPWACIALEHDAERRPAPPPVPRDPPHVSVLRWLDGLVGGREALLALDDSPAPESERPVIDDPAMRSAYAEVEHHLDRVVASFFEDEVGRLLTSALVAVWSASPEMVIGRPANQVTGGLVWVVGRANALFGAGLTQTTVRRELRCQSQLSGIGQSIAGLLRGVDLWDARRPASCPDLVAFANPSLLTSTTRRLLIRWRDEALRVERSCVLPVEVERASWPR
jgi:hypothetical protein